MAAAPCRLYVKPGESDHVSGAEARFASGDEDALSPLGGLRAEHLDIGWRPHNFRAIHLVNFGELIAMVVFELGCEAKRPLFIGGLSARRFRPKHCWVEIGVDQLTNT